MSSRLAQPIMSSKETKRSLIGAPFADGYLDRQFLLRGVNRVFDLILDSVTKADRCFNDLQVALVAKRMAEADLDLGLAIAIVFDIAPMLLEKGTGLPADQLD